MVMVSNQSKLEFGYLAARYPGSLGHLYSPGGERGPWPFMPYALDNGAFAAGANWSVGEWRALIRWAALSGQKPLWALVPDVVGDRKATIENWARYADEVRAYKFRLAFAIQNGMTFDDVPEDDCVLFIGGDDAFKDAAIDPWCRAFPNRVHVARVNHWDRLVRSWRAGAVSVDGTGWFHHKQCALLSKFIRETSEGPSDAYEAARLVS